MKRILVLFVMAIALSFVINRVSFSQEMDQGMMDAPMADMKTPMMGMEESEMDMAMAPMYEIDEVHSTIGFGIKHMAISTTRGSFSDYSGMIHYDPQNLDAFMVDVTIQAASIDTKNEKRDEHLRGADFFEVETYPTITFKSSTLKKTDEGYEIIGDLTMKDVTKEITLDAEIMGPVEGMGKKMVGLEAEGKIDRKDFNIVFNKVLDNGGLAVGNEVDLMIELELHEK